MTRTTIDWRASVSFGGTITKYLAAAITIPLLVSLLYREDV